MSLKRLKNDFIEMILDPPDNCIALPNSDNIYKWRAIIFGPPDSPYDGGLFYLKLKFSLEYPFVPPVVTFKTPIYHPNVDWPTGLISLQSWQSAILSVSKLLSSISALLFFPDTMYPLNVDAGACYNIDREKFKEIALDWTEKYAK